MPPLSIDFVEILAGGVNNGSALGDEENDIPALQEAGLGIAMANAAERVKRAARFIAGPNTADGWAEAIERYVLTG